MGEWFSKLSRKAGEAAGSPYAFVAAVATILAWAASGPLFGFSDTWQLIVNTSTTIVTFLLVFLVQGSQNRDTAALNLKLDEVICALDKASDNLIDIEHGTDRELIEARERVVANKDPS